MSIETLIEGNPDSIRTASDWLRGSLATGIDTAVESIDASRSAADGGWDGEAGDNFSEKMKSAGNKGNDLSSAARESATSIDDAAAALQTAQSMMEQIRSDAAAAGLTVNGTVIEHPGDAPPTPISPPTGDAATPAAVSAYNAAVIAAEEYARKAEAYEVAEVEAAAARSNWEEALKLLVGAFEASTTKTWFLIADMISAHANAWTDLNPYLMGKRAELLRIDGIKYLELARNAGPGTPAATVYRDVDLGRQFLRQADELVDAAADSAKATDARGLKLGGAFAAAGVAYDIYDGKPVDQALVSGGLGFGASVAAGALIGTAIPVPVLGTATGAIVGAGVGIFTSGAIDSVFDNGLDVGKALSSGGSAVADTTKAVGGVFSGAWNAIF
ncbi:DUF1269 domain-containing protein [Rhodococcus triatomae]|uniref:WXG100 family type VII secretion target n=1 Tax=Rhodococcus triatomae TaxID=300028 RepID=A0A1G8M402_9NOCA|nr:DUF1269 domain-containing protein [Rhodococcus triatomae]QNG17330.1 DUF1269 domain-containing protein [Rhodococcus triatomae]QNG21648.1 DUF1269 domain-containing protein [Rhodococcus triatomae]SDI62674.1 hypothetical protein SAMN05444695_10998 [Rhodococcus triatomae]